MYRVSSLGRPLDPRLRSNLAAVAGSAAAGLVVAVYSALSDSPLATSPVVAAVGVFLAWAIGRELDPDRPVVAGLAMAIAFPSLLYSPAELLLGTAVLLATRVISGTVGVPLRGLDMVALVVLGGLLGAGGISSAAVPGLLVASVIGAGGRSRGWQLLVLIVISAGIGAIAFGPRIAWTTPSGIELAMLAAVIGAGFWGAAARASISARSDTGGSLHSRRVVGSRWVAGGSVLIAFLAAGGAGLVAAFATSGAAVVATGLVAIGGHRRADRKVGAVASHG